MEFILPLRHLLTNTFSGNGLMFLKGTLSGIVANNTFISPNSGIGLGYGPYGPDMGSNQVIRNNLFYGVPFPISQSYSTTNIVTSDNNIFYCIEQPKFNFGNWTQYRFEQ